MGSPNVLCLGDRVVVDDRGVLAARIFDLWPRHEPVPSPLPGVVAGFREGENTPSPVVVTVAVPLKLGAPVPTNIRVAWASLRRA